MPFSKIFSVLPVRFLSGSTGNRCECHINRVFGSVSVYGIIEIITLRGGRNQLPGIAGSRGVQFVGGYGIRCFLIRWIVHIDIGTGVGRFCIEIGGGRHIDLSVCTTV